MSSGYFVGLAVLAFIAVGSHSHEEKEEPYRVPWGAEDLRDDKEKDWFRRDAIKKGKNFRFDGEHYYLTD